MNKDKTRRLVFSGACLALCMVLPLLTGQIQQIGNALCPMHIPVLICGFACGWPWGLAVGLIAPIMRSAIFGMPQMYFAIAMAFELAAYGAFAGILHRVLPDKPIFIYATLVSSMLLGRAVWGSARFVMAGLSGSEFPFSAFIAGAFTTAVPGIILHIVLIPLVIMALKRAGLIFNTNLN